MSQCLFVGVYEPHPSASIEAEYMAEWMMLTKPDEQLSKLERATLTGLYQRRTRAALVTAPGSHSEEKMKYRHWLNWVIRPNGPIEKTWTRSEHKRVGTDQKFLSAIIRRNGPGMSIPHIQIARSTYHPVFCIQNGSLQQKPSCVVVCAILDPVGEFIRVPVNISGSKEGRKSPKMSSPTYLMWRISLKTPPPESGLNWSRLLLASLGGTKKDRHRCHLSSVLIWYVLICLLGEY